MKKIKEVPMEEKESAEDVKSRDEKKAKREEGASKRRSAKKKDKAARWSGAILFAVLVFVGFLMWVAGEVKTDRPEGMGITPQETVRPQLPVQRGKVVVE